METDYRINPVKMGGLVKEATKDQVKVHLHGRLGVITVPPKLVLTSRPPVPGDEVEFYFSYIQVVEQPYGYDSFEMTGGQGMFPCLLGGKMIEVNDTAVKIRIMDQLGTIAVPLRWLFTDVPLTEGLDVSFYLSRMGLVASNQFKEDNE